MFSQNLILAGDIGDKYVIFFLDSGSHLGFNRRNTENIELNLCEILPVYLVDRLSVSFSYRGQILYI